MSVPVLGDTISEPTETFVVNLSNPANATILDGQGAATIADNDTAPTLSVGDATVTEGNSGTVHAIFAVTLAPERQAGDGGVRNGRRHRQRRPTTRTTAGTLTFAPGQLNRKLSVRSRATDRRAGRDVPREPDRSDNATILDGQGVGTITNDDAPPPLSIGDAVVTEGDAGTVRATFVVTLSGPPAGKLGERWNFATAAGSATAVRLRLPVPPGGSLAFAPGETTKTVAVAVTGDAADEDGETFFVTLSGAGNATVADGQGSGAIDDDDGLPSLSINDVTTGEGQSGTIPANFTVTPELAQRADGQRRLRDGGRQARTLPTTTSPPAGTSSSTRGRPRRPSRSRCEATSLDEIDETLPRQPLRAGQRDDRRRAGRWARSRTTTRRPPLSVNDVTVTEGNAGTVECELHGQPERAERTGGDGRLRDRQRHRSGRPAITRPAAGRSPSRPARPRSR